MKRLISVLLVLFLLSGIIFPAYALETPDLSAESFILMEAETGTILCENNSRTHMEPASITKIMTLLLVMEALEEGRLSTDDIITVSPYAASMGGSQIWLREGEQMTVHDLLKAVAVVSANDASVAFAEHLAGSEEAFVARMNERARQLGMADTSFVNCTGLPAEGHLSSAYDIALMSQELLTHPLIFDYSTIWMDSLRGGASVLTNTNRLIRYYEGATGLKTGSTDSALYCLSATAERDGMTLIAVVLKSSTSALRFEDAQALLNLGFANYAMTEVTPDQVIPPVDVLLGNVSEIQPILSSSDRLLLEKSKASAIQTDLQMIASVEAPVAKGQQLGSLIVSANGEILKEIPIVSADEIARLTIWGIFGRLLQTLCMVNL